MSTQIPGHLGPSGATPDLFSGLGPQASAPRPAGALRRKLHAGHFAFMRAIVQGVELQSAWDRYLRWEEEGGDARAMRATIAWLRDEFAAAARREARFGTARLVLLDASRVPDAATELPPLELFVDLRGLEDFPQAEQIALYEAEYGRASQRQRRRARLIARQLEALGWIEQQVAQPPRAADSVAYWLNPLLVGPLTQGGLHTLGDLRADIDGRGPRWYRRLHGIGETKAARIEAWIEAHRATLGGPQPQPQPQQLRSPSQLPSQPTPEPQSASYARPGSTAHPAASAPASLDVPRSGMAASLRSAPVPPTRTSPTERDRRVPAAHFAPSAASIRAGLAPAAGPASAAGLASAAGPAAAAHLAHDAIRPAPASAARVPPDLAPLDRFACPAALDGRQGQNRRSAADLLMPMDDDRGAIQAWLAAPPATSQGAAPRSPHTRRAYHREAERLLLWSVVERGKALSSLDADDCHAYRAFLVDPQPRARWCVQSSPGRQSALWRPFTGPLGAAGQRQAAAALSSLFGFLVEQRYLWTNPWRERPSAAAVSGGKPAPDAAAAGVPNAGLRAKGAAGLALPAAAINDAPVSSASAPPPAGRPGAARALDASRSLSPVLWAHVLDAADALPDGGAHPRLRFALRWLYATGLRLSEAVGARLGDLRREPPEPAHPSQLDLPDHTHTPDRPDRAGQPGHLELLDDAAQPDHAGQLDHAARPPRQPGRPSQFSQEGRPSQSVQPVQPNQASQANQADQAGHANPVDQVDQADQADSVDQPNRLLQSPQLPQFPRSGHPAQPGQPLVQARPGEPGRPGPADLPPVWWLQVAPDAFGRQRRLPLPDSLVGALSDYLRQRGLDQDPLAPGQRDAFVLGQAIERGERARRLPQPGPVDARQGVRASTLARQLKQHFGRCAAARAAAGDVPGARQLAAASAHWLRHTHARHLLANGLPLELAQRHLGHAARSTTAAYLVSERPSTRGDWQAAWDATMAAQRGGAPYPGAPADTSTHDLPDR